MNGFYDRDRRVICTCKGGPYDSSKKSFKMHFPLQKDPSSQGVLKLEEGTI